MVGTARIAVGGSSAGGHVALWTAIEKAPPGSDAATSPKSKPAALILKSAVTDTSPETGYTPKRFGDDAMALSPVHQLDANMPPTLILHAAMDELVHYGTAVALYNKLKSTKALEIEGGNKDRRVAHTRRAASSSAVKFLS